MNRTAMMSVVFFVLGLAFMVTGCTDDAVSKPNFIFKKPVAGDDVVAEINGKKYKAKDIFKGAEMEIYEAEQKVYEIKMGKLRARILEEMMNADPKKKGLSNDEYLSKYIAKDIKISDKEINDFAIKRGIPNEQLNDVMKGRIKEFLTVQKQRDAVDKWMGEATKKNPVTVFFMEPEMPSFNVTVGKAPMMGKKSAKVTIVEFSDFQCPYCAKGADILKEIKGKYGDKVNFAFKNYPLPFHKDAKLAAHAALCAHEQKPEAFWNLHDKMFADQQGLKRDGLVAKAKGLGIDMKKFEECLDSGRHNKWIEADIEEGKEIGVKSTPTFFVNGKMVNGARDLDFFSELIDAEL